MVAQQTQPQYTKYDDMSPPVRRTLENAIYNNKHYDYTPHWNASGEWTNALTPTFITQIDADIKTYKDNAAAEKAKALEEQRVRNNANWDRYNTNGSSYLKEQPTERYTGKNIGKQGYKWLRNFKATNGNWYAEYQPVRGGETRKFYNLAIEEWDDNAYVISLSCNSCKHRFRGIAPIKGNVCPNCGADDSRLQYRGRYS